MTPHLTTIEVENNPAQDGFAHISFVHREFPNQEAATRLAEDLSSLLDHPVVIFDFDDLGIVDHNLLARMLWFCREMIKRDHMVLACNMEYLVRESFDFADVSRLQHQGKNYVQLHRLDREARLAARDILEARKPKATVSAS